MVLIHQNGRFAPAGCGGTNMSNHREPAGSAPCGLTRGVHLTGGAGFGISAIIAPGSVVAVVAARMVSGMRRD